jgi:hypothetical protein
VRGAKGEFAVKQGYESPRLLILGTVKELTLQQGQDPCRWNNPRNGFKQTGPADLILGQAALATCSP